PNPVTPTNLQVQWIGGNRYEGSRVCFAGIGVNWRDACGGKHKKLRTPPHANSALHGSSPQRRNRSPNGYLAQKKKLSQRRSCSVQTISGGPGGSGGRESAKATAAR